MIVGIGIDLIEVARVRDSHERFGEVFLNRILLPGEIEYCLGHTHPAPHLAARFAAKEAIGKAFGTGIGGKFGWHDAEIARSESGQPHVILNAKGMALASRLGGATVHVSLSHLKDHACAVAVLEG